ncbi:DUF1456 family protein [Carnobacterium gallinarum]|uniref:DUF1456 family protein n=1 Tax=Carnobacterium gallinarum TaxID=2749 RepID=UPI00055335CC|nr:DUF1456 family protein [Carnobacterium gallinarum]
MNNNDRLTRLRYALNLKDEEMVEIFALSDVDLSKDEVSQMLTKVKGSNENNEDEFAENDYLKKCDNQTFEAFLNGLITLKRGPRPESAENNEKPQAMIKNDRNVNNVMLKKLKIALSLTSDDILDILDSTGVILSNSELSAVLRKEGHRNYKECGDRYARNFLKGLTYKYRD